MTLRNRFTAAKQESAALTRVDNPFGFFDHMPQDVVNIIAGKLHENDRASFAYTAKRFAKATRTVNLARVKISAIQLLSASQANLSSLTAIQFQLETLTHYTYGFQSDNEKIQEKQARLARTMQILLTYMYYIQANTSLTFSFLRGHEYTDTDGETLGGYDSIYSDINTQDAVEADSLVKKIESVNYDEMKPDALEKMLKSRMTDLAQLFHTFSDAIAAHNTPATICSRLFSYLPSCGLWRQPAYRETTLVRLLTACANSIGYQLNELNNKVLAPIQLIEPQRINRR